MKIRVTYKVNYIEFSSCCASTADAYEHIKAIVMNEHVNFPNTDEVLSGYIELLANIGANITLSHENHVFRVARIAD